MEEVKAEVSKRANLVSEFAITDKNLKKEIAKWKNWTAPRIDDIPNFWWKKVELTQKVLRKAFTDLYIDTVMIPEWCCPDELFCFQKRKILAMKRITVQLHASIHHIRSWWAWWQNTREHTAVNEIWDKYWAQSVSSSATDVSWRRSGNIIATWQ